MPRLAIEPLGTAEAVLVDALGSATLVVQPAQQAAVRLDLAGKLNKEDRRWQGTFLLSPGQAAELVADLVITGGRAMRVAGEDDDAFTDACKAAVRRRMNDPSLDEPIT